MISNKYQTPNGRSENTGLNAGTVYPPELSGLFSHLKIHPAELTSAHILPFVPKLAEINQDKDRRVSNIAKNIAECSSLHNSITWIMDNQEWDFAAIYLDTIDHFCHGFMDFHPPKMSNVSEKDFELYKDVIVSAYKYHDMMLETLLSMIDKDTTVILVSDHGFHSDGLRPVFIPNEPAGPAYQHRNHGVFYASGPGIKKNEEIYGLSLVDITPTLLSLYDLPVGDDMDGTAQIQIFETKKSLKSIPSWEEVEGEAGMHPKNMKSNPVETQEEIRQLIELGYIEDPGEDFKKAAEKTKDETDYNLARVYIGSGRYKKAVPVLEKLYEKYPSESRFVFRLSNCYNEQQEYGKSRKLLVELQKNIFKNILSQENFDKIKEIKIPNELSFKEKQKISEKKQNEIRKTEQAQNDILNIKFKEINILLKENKAEKALEILNSFETVAGAYSPTKRNMVQSGNIYRSLGKYKKAEEIYTEVVEKDPHSIGAYYGLTLVSTAKADWEKAIERALTTIELNFYYPEAHFLLGNALYNLDAFEQSVQAFELCLKMKPELGKARNLLIEIYMDFLNQPEKAKIHKNYFSVKSKNVIKTDTKNEHKKTPSRDLKDPIIVVSGLPRSGTSLMMQILDKAGIEIFFDKKREADNSNPNGYYEHQSVTKIATDKSWLKNTKGKAVKIIAQLLKFLPPRYNYKIIFMERDIDEVLMSQHKMLSEQGKVQEGVYSLELDMAFRKTLKSISNFVSDNHNVEILYIKHQELLINPEPEIKKVIDFLSLNSSAENLSSVINRKLYRAVVKK